MNDPHSLARWWCFKSLNHSGQPKAPLLQHAMAPVAVDRDGQPRTVNNGFDVRIRAATRAGRQSPRRTQIFLFDVGPLVVAVHRRRVEHIVLGTLVVDDDNAHAAGLA